MKTVKFSYLPTAVIDLTEIDTPNLGIIKIFDNVSVLSCEMVKSVMIEHLIG